tara:strand:- start:14115 stop:14396 length:282 start_codon:yes stop_codon:yes gene_type:complete
MKKFLLLAFLTMVPVASLARPNTSYYRLSASQQASIDKMCSYQVGVEYGTDNMTDEQYWEFDRCRNTFADFMVVNRPIMNPPFHFPSPQILQQ